MFHTALLTCALRPCLSNPLSPSNHCPRGLPVSSGQLFHLIPAGLRSPDLGPRCPTPHPHPSPGTACSRGTWMGPSVWAAWPSS